MNYLIDNPVLIAALLLRHMQMTSIALGVGLVVAFPIALLIEHYQRLAAPLLGILGMLYTIPSLALIILLIPVFGLGQFPVIVALILYTQVILVRNIVTGLRTVDPAVLEAAEGMGMNTWQRWVRVQIPLALPVILAGIRLAAIVAVGIAAIGAKFGAGGLGDLLFQGIAQTGRYDKIWAGTIVLAVLALSINSGLLLLERKLSIRQAIATVNLPK
jgi:osmoprotectant transport system permease protein